LARALSLAGLLALRQGDTGRALSLHENSLGLFREVGDQRGTAFALHNLAFAFDEHGDYDRAARLYEEGLALSRQLGDKYRVAMSVGNHHYRPTRSARYQQSWRHHHGSGGHG
jgi:tetratricopeptide (TPR) repeat protein